MEWARFRLVAVGLGQLQNRAHVCTCARKHAWVRAYLVHTGTHLFLPICLELAVHRPVFLLSFVRPDIPPAMGPSNNPWSLSTGLYGRRLVGFRIGTQVKVRIRLSRRWCVRARVCAPSACLLLSGPDVASGYWLDPPLDWLSPLLHAGSCSRGRFLRVSR